MNVIVSKICSQLSENLSGTLDITELGKLVDRSSTKIQARQPSVRENDPCTVVMFPTFQFMFFLARFCKDFTYLVLFIAGNVSQAL